jgi:MFS family permease
MVLAALFLGIGQIGTLFAVNDGFVAAAAILAAPVRVPGIARGRGHRRGCGSQDPPRRRPSGRRPPPPRFLVSLMTAQYVIVGSLDVLFVVLAIQVLGRDQAWVGYLNTAYGVGAVAAGLLTAHLIGPRLSRALTLAVVTLSAGLVLSAFSHVAGVVLVLIAVVGGGRAVLVVSVNTMLQRVVPAQLVGRVFGVVEGLSMAGLALGSVLTPLLIGRGGPTQALVVVGGLLPATALCRVRTLRRLDRGATVPVVEVPRSARCRTSPTCPPRPWKPWPGR